MPSQILRPAVDKFASGKVYKTDSVFHHSYLFCIDSIFCVVSMLIIDKKRLPLKESGLPQMVIDQAPKLMRRSKLPIVKAKVGPKISVLIADEKVFDLIPVKKEVKAEVSGLYIVGVKGIRGSLETPAPKKKGFFARLRNK